MCRMLVVDSKNSQMLPEKVRIYVHLLKLPVELQVVSSPEAMTRSLRSDNRIDILMADKSNLQPLSVGVEHPPLKKMLISEEEDICPEEDEFLLSPSLDMDSFYRAVSALVPETAKKAPSFKKSSRWYGSNPAMLNRILDVLRIIREEYSSDLSLEYLAGRVYVSPCYLSTMFSRFVGVSPLAYLNDYRMHRAVQSLTETDTSVTAICSEVGYRNLPYFCTCFKNKYGVTPAQFRERFRLPDALGA